VLGLWLFFFLLILLLQSPSRRGKGAGFYRCWLKDDVTRMRCCSLNGTVIDA
jgi:hypothetical protein